MLRSLNSGISGLRFQQDKLDVIGNNIANVNTVGFRAGRAQGVDVFSQRLSEFSTNSSASQIGSGVSLASVSSSFAQGNIDATGQPYNMAIDGSGFFIVRDTSNNATYATRAGDFRADANGFLTTTEGMRVQGEIPGSPGVSSDIKITLIPTAPALPADTEAVSWRIESNGDVMLTLRSTLVPPPATPPDPLKIAQIQVQKFRDINGLSKVGNNRFGNLAAAGPVGLGTAGQAGRGQVRWQSLEQANVDLATQFTDLMVTQRGYQANAKIITTSDEILQELINLKR
ncbi:MAG: flagellar hook-basal body complex protein [Verrucomicrobia bacterium]|nr:flagellar hook-basal body complex protein [Verrucomicrobiota bacterium]